MSEQEPIQSVRGVHDILPDDQRKWQFIRRELNTTARLFGFSRIDVPVIEYAELFDRSIGTETDIVSKELFLVSQKEGQTGSLMALRPEFTAGIVRAYIQHGFRSKPQPVRLYTHGSLFRYDRPQKGRYREHTQFGAEILGAKSAADDAWIIYLGWRFLQRLGLKDVQIQINSLGSKLSQEQYVKKVQKYFMPFKEQLSPTDQRRLELNPLRLIDSKDEVIQQHLEDAPQSLDSLDKESKEFFSQLLGYLDEYNVSYNLNPRIVRGLDYYTHTAFEITVENETGQQGSLGGGGRYDGLAEQIGSVNVSGVGLGIGLDRVMNELVKQHTKVPAMQHGCDLYLIHLSKRGRRKAQEILELLHNGGFVTLHSPDRPGLRSQLKQADKLQARYAIIIGETEAKSNICILRDMKSGIQEDILYTDLVSTLTDRLRNGRSARLLH